MGIIGKTECHSDLLPKVRTFCDNLRLSRRLSQTVDKPMMQGFDPHGGDCEGGRESPLTLYLCKIRIHF